MIQRIQSIFLLLASGASFSMFGLPFADIEGVQGGTVAGLNVLEDLVFNLQDNIGLLILAIVTGGIAFLTIFLFKNRTLQMKLCTLTIVANIILVVLAGVLFYQEMDLIDTVKNTDTSYYMDVEYGVLAPFLAIIFTVLANRGIKKDDKLVKSMDRLR